MSFRHRLIPLAALLVLSGCNTAHSAIGSGDTRFGEAAKFNAAVQTINPDPIFPHDGALPGRYRTDTVKQVEDIKTSSSTTSGGSPH